MNGRPDIACFHRRRLLRRPVVMSWKRVDSLGVYDESLEMFYVSVVRFFQEFFKLSHFSRLAETSDFAEHSRRLEFSSI